MELIIDRSKWLRGEGSTHSKLIRESDGKMCCLGFYGLACNIPREALLDKSSPDQPKSLDIWRSKGPMTDWLFVTRKSDYQEGLTVYERSDDSSKLMAENDCRSDLGTDKVREEVITRIFAKHGVTVKFIDGPNP